MRRHIHRFALLFVFALVLTACTQDEPALEGDAATPSPAAGSPSPTAGGQATATVRVATSSQGSILVDAGGRTLYVFTNDASGQSNCNDACEQRWPPLRATGTAQAGEGAQASLLGTVTRRDGSSQVSYNNRPLYLFSEDRAPGETKGQGVGGVWFVVSAQGEPIRS